MLKISLVAASAAVSLTVHAADVYVSFDDAGVARFAERAVDDSYRLLFKDLQPQTKRLTASHPGPSAEIRSALEGAAQRHGLQYALLHAIAQVESGFNPMAISPKGAIGLMQLMPGTAQRYGVQANDAAALRNKLHQLSINIEASGRYLTDLMRQFNGQTELVLAAYNAGEGAVRRAGNQIPAYPETRMYIEKVMAIFRTIQEDKGSSDFNVLPRTPQPSAGPNRAKEPRKDVLGVQLFRGGETVEFN